MNAKMFIKKVYNRKIMLLHECIIGMNRKIKEIDLYANNERKHMEPMIGHFI